MATDPRRDPATMLEIRKGATPDEHARVTTGTKPAAESVDEEVDVWWGSYEGRKFAPWIVLTAVFSGILVGFAWYLREWHGNVVRYWVQLAMAMLWIVQL